MQTRQAKSDERVVAPGKDYIGPKQRQSGYGLLRVGECRSKRWHRHTTCNPISTVLRCL